MSEFLEKSDDSFVQAVRDAVVEQRNEIAAAIEKEQADDSIQSLRERLEFCDNVIQNPADFKIICINGLFFAVFGMRLTVPVGHVGPFLQGYAS